MAYARNKNEAKYDIDWSRVEERIAAFFETQGITDIPAWIDSRTDAQIAALTRAIWKAAIRRQPVGTP